MKQPKVFIAGAATALMVTDAASAEDASAVSFAADYTTDLLANVSGGADTGFRRLDSLDVTLGVDLERFIGLDHTQVFVYGLYNNGQSISELAGDAQAVSSIEAPVEAARLYEAWIDHRFGGGPLSVRAGLYDINSEFDVLEATNFFIHGAHGTGTDLGQSGRNGPSVFPFTSLAARAEIDFGGGLKFRTAIADGAPGDPDHPKRTAVKLGNGDGAFIISEAEFSNDRFRVIGGGWNYTSEFERYDGAMGDDNDGFYAGGEISLTGHALEGARGVVAFLRAGQADGDYNQFSKYYSAGLVWKTPLLAEGDAIGLGVAWSHASAAFLAANPFFAGNEAAIEFSASVAATEWLTVQPQVQYIINPSAEAGLDDAVVVGVRASASLNGLVNSF